MKLVVQRVSKASVVVSRKTVGEIGHGVLLLVGVAHDDTEETVSKMARKIVALRIFADEQNKMNRSIKEVKGEILAVPQFTLFAELKGQNRPYFGDAAKLGKAEKLFHCLIDSLLKLGIPKVEIGTFGAYMRVELINDGPVTLGLDSKEL